MSGPLGNWFMPLSMAPQPNPLLREKFLYSEWEIYKKAK